MSTALPQAIQSPSRSGRLRGIAINLALAATSLVVVLGGLELVLRFAGFQTRGTWSAPCYEPVPDIGHLFIPGFQGTMYKGISSGWADVPVRINTHGLRGPEFPLAKPPGVQRVLVLGDSFVFGYLLPEEDAYAAQLQHLLDERRGRGRVQVINAGVPGYGIRNETAFLEHRGLAFEPDVIVVTASGGDIADAGIRQNRDGEEGIDMSRELRLYRLVRTSALMNFMQFLSFGIIHASDPKLSLNGGFHAAKPSGAIRQALRRYGDEFAHLTNIARRYGAPVIFVAYPGELDLFTDNTVVRDHWRRLADAHGARFVDLLPSFKDGRRKKLFLPADGHPNAEANRLVAEAVADELARTLPRPQSSS